MNLCTTILDGQNITPVVIANDGFEQTPELRQFPDIRTGLIDSTFKMIVVRNGTASIGIAITLPVGQSGSINWGDGNTTALTASGAAVNYYHTWTAWQASTDGLEEYNIVTVSGNITAIAAIASAVTAPCYWTTILWMAAKSMSLKSFSLAVYPTIYPTTLRRVDFDTPNMLFSGLTFYNSLSLKVFNYNGNYASNINNMFVGSAVDEMTISNPALINASAAFSNSRIKRLTLSLSISAAVSFTNLFSGGSCIEYFSTNTAWGNFSAAFPGASCLRIIDFTSCAVNGITNFTGNTNLYSLQKLLFPSTGTGTSRVPKAFASGMTSMGAIDITNSGLPREALVEMFRSLPVNAAAVNCTITGSVGAASLTTDEIAIATAKNWNVIRA